MNDQLMDAIEEMIEVKIWATQSNHATAIKERYKFARARLAEALIEYKGYNNENNRNG